MEKVIDFAFSVQGHNHIKEHKVCQDASSCFSDERMNIIAVADGHGGNDYTRTDRGSAFAVKTAISSTRQFIDTIFTENLDISADSDQRLEQLAKSILAAWHSLVDEDLAKHPFIEDELKGVSDKYRERYLSGKMLEKAYGTTLILACVTKQFWFGLQIGDGKCVVLTSQCETLEPIPWDDSCQANITTSICDSEAISEFRYYFSQDIPLAIFMGSDGIDDSYPSQEEYQSLYRSIVMLFDENGEDKGKEELLNYLPSLSRRGSGDDVTIAGILSPDVFQEKTIQLIKAINFHSKAVGEHNRKSSEAKLATERLDYTLTAIKRAKAAYDSALDKEKSAREEVEHSKVAFEEAEQRLKEAETRLEKAKAAFSHEDDSFADAMPSWDMQDSNPLCCLVNDIQQTPLTLDSDSNI